MNVVLHPEARAELMDAAVYYEEQSLGLGGRFIDAFERTKDLLAGQPGLGMRVDEAGRLRRHPLRRFPFYVIYEATPGMLRILAVAHQRRRPGYWSDRRNES